MTRTVSCFFVIASLAGCSSSAPSTNDAALKDGALGTDASPVPLSCSSLVWCTNNSVGLYHDTLPTPSGGAISVGFYRLAYVIRAGATSTTGPYATTSADGLALGANGALRTFAFRGGDNIGTYATSGTMLSLMTTQSCKPDGEPGVVDSRTTSYPYSFVGNKLLIFFGSEVAYYVSASDPCMLVGSLSSTPGDSYQCATSPCYCSDAQNNTITPSSCGS